MVEEELAALQLEASALLKRHGPKELVLKPLSGYTLARQLALPSLADMNNR